MATETILIQSDISISTETGTILLPYGTIIQKNTHDAVTLMIQLPNQLNKAIWQEASTKGTITAPKPHVPILSLKDLITYEIHSSRLARYFYLAWLQKIVGRYYAWKVSKKYVRYIRSIQHKQK
jgi:hypothetical protein